MSIVVRRWMLMVLVCLGFSGTANASPFYATSVVDSSVMYPTGDFVLGAPDGNSANSEPVLTGQEPGFLVVAFDRPFLDEAGDDLIIHLYDWGNSEAFWVLASIDGVVFEELGFSGFPNGATQIGFDLADGGLSSAQFVRVNNWASFNRFAGPDIDAFEVHSASPVPAPTTTALLALGLLGAAFSRRRRVH